MFFGLIGVLFLWPLLYPVGLTRKLHKEDQRRTQLLEKYFMMPESYTSCGSSGKRQGWYRCH
jgi:hypothetical protein